MMGDIFVQCLLFFGRRKILSVIVNINTLLQQLVLLPSIFFHILVLFVFLSEENETQFPVIIYSHGNGICADTCSNICADLASFGYIVFALDHEDGTNIYAKDVRTSYYCYSFSLPL